MTNKIYPSFQNYILPDTTLRINTGIILYFRRSLFLELRSDNKMWGFLGGSVDIGESPLTTIIREVKEESGINLIESNIELLGVYGDISDYRVALYPEGSFHFIDIIYTYQLSTLPHITLSDESLAISQFDFSDIPFNDLIHAAFRPINDFIAIADK